MKTFSTLGLKPQAPEKKKEKEKKDKKKKDSFLKEISAKMVKSKPSREEKKKKRKERSLSPILSKRRIMKLGKASSSSFGAEDEVSTLGQNPSTWLNLLSHLQLELPNQLRGES